jgi:hypothetical protein
MLWLGGGGGSGLWLWGSLGLVLGVVEGWWSWCAEGEKGGVGGLGCELCSVVDWSGVDAVLCWSSRKILLEDMSVVIG